MRFQIQKGDLLKTLQRIIGVLPTRTTIPILNSILLEVEGEVLRLSGTDLEVSVSTSITMKGEEDGACAIPGRLLNDLLRELPEMPVLVEKVGEERVNLSTSQGQYKLPIDPKSAFPALTLEEGVVEFGFSTTRLARMIEKTIHAVSSDELRTNLMGVLFELRQGQFRLVATDGHRLVKISDTGFDAVQQLPGGVDGDEAREEAIVPTKALNLYLKNVEDIERVRIVFGENHIVFHLDGTEIYSKLFEGTFPNYESVIPTENDKQMTVNRDALIAALRRVSIFSNAVTHQVKLSISEGKVEVSSEDIDAGGEGQEGVPVELAGDELEVGFNAQYLIDMLRHIDTEEAVFELSDSVSAGLIYPATQQEAEELMMLIMPIKLQDAELEEEYE